MLPAWRDRGAALLLAFVPLALLAAAFWFGARNLTAWVLVLFAALARKVEMFQWHETNGDIRSYDMDWVDHPVDASKFAQPQRHENPVSRRICVRCRPTWRRRSRCTTACWSAAPIRIVRGWVICV